MYQIPCKDKNEIFVFLKKDNKVLKINLDHSSDIEPLQLEKNKDLDLKTFQKLEGTPHFISRKAKDFFSSTLHKWNDRL